MLLSSIFPGAGQYYANKHSVTAYVFPVIEIGLWVGYFHYNGLGDDKEDEYKKFANEHYERSRQAEVQVKMIEFFSSQYSNSKYDKTHFRLDGITWTSTDEDVYLYFIDNSENSQHFYEDIGKYNKYIFGWDDWYETYNDNGNIYWAHEPEEVNNGDGYWLGNYAGDPSETSEYDAPYSANRKNYIKMRQDAEEYYDTAVYFNWALIANHIGSAIDAVRVTKKFNQEYLSQNTPKIYFNTVRFAGNMTPMIGAYYQF